jgi:hypothetical protein
MTGMTQIAQAVVDELNADVFTQPFTAARSYLPQTELSEMVDLHVTVVPKAETVESAGRGSGQYEYSLDVAVQKRCQDDTEIDGLLALAEEIGRFFCRRRLANVPEAIWIRTEHGHLYAPEHLAQLHQFTSVLTLTFRVIQ